MRIVDLVVRKGSFAVLVVEFVNEEAELVEELSRKLFNGDETKLIQEALRRYVGMYIGLLVRECLSKLEVECSK